MQSTEFEQFAIAQVLSDSNQIVGLVDPDMVVRWISSSASAYNLEAVGRSIIDLIHPDDLERAVQAFDGAAQREGFEPSLMAHAIVPIRIVTNNGTVPFETSGRWVVDDDGNDWLIAILQDVTTRHATDQALRKLVERPEELESMQTVVAACRQYGGVEGAQMLWTTDNKKRTYGDLGSQPIAGFDAWRDLAELSDAGAPIEVDGSDWGYVLPVVAGRNRLGAMALWGAGPAPALSLVAAAMAPLLDLAALALKRARELAELHRQATTDEVTGLMNRHAFFSKLDQIVQRAAVMYIDLDAFKSVNDRFGHTMGDRLLNVIGRRLADAVHPDDSIARIGGDEFAVLTQSVSPAEARATGDRIIDALNQTFVIDGHRVKTGASVGIAYSDSSTTGRHVLESADQALLEAKAQGKGRAVVVSSF